MGISNGFGTLSGMFCPIFTEFMTKKGVSTQYYLVTWDEVNLILHLAPAHAVKRKMTWKKYVSIESCSLSLSSSPLDVNITSSANITLFLPLSWCFFFLLLIYISYFQFLVLLLHVNPDSLFSWFVSPFSFSVALLFLLFFPSSFYLHLLLHLHPHLSFSACCFTLLHSTLTFFACQKILKSKGR